MNQSPPEFYCEPMVGWRVWRLTVIEGEPRLQSAVYSQVWEPGVPVSATCLRYSRSGEEPHECPEQACSCGIHAATSTGGGPVLTRYLSPPYTLMPHMQQFRLVGEVALWGRVVEHTSGFRAAFAYPKRLFIPRQASEHASLLGAYRVPVECVDRLADVLEAG